MTPPTMLADAASTPSPLSAERGPTDASAPRHFDFVDALRGLAILLVMSIHVSFKVPDFHGRFRGAVAQGQYGVQLFFIVSAFTLFWSLRSRRSHERRPLLAFYTRRFFRIAPLFWTAIAFYMWQPMPWRGGLAPAGVHWPQVLATAALVHSWWPTSINSVVPGGWSVGAEAMFYLCIPFLYARVRTLNGALWMAVVTATLVGGLSSPAARIIGHHFPASWTPLVQEFVFESFPSQLPVFCIGMVLYFLLAEPDSDRRRPGGLLLVVMAAYLTFAPPAKHVLPSAAFATLAVGLAKRPVALLVNPVTRFIGRVSFSCYIWHFWVLEHVMGPTLSHLSAPHRHVSPTLQFCTLWGATVLATLPIATASYYAIEVPGQNLGRWLINSMAWGNAPRGRPINGAVPNAVPAAAQ